MNSDNDGFQKVCSVAELADNYGKRFMVDDPEGSGQIIDIAIYEYRDKIYAMSNICPHQQSALIYDGHIEDKCVVCPVHGWKFNIETGLSPSGAGKLQLFEVKIIDDNIFVKVKMKKLNW